jgi:thiamine-phosphate pyrophosphorylase
MASYETARLSGANLRGIYVIINEGSDNPISTACAVLNAGVRVIQYRAKNGIAPANAYALRALTRERRAIFIMNDDWRAALEYDCDGVHLGPGDPGYVNVEHVRQALGPRFIGLSCGTVEEARAAQELGVDYIGVGSVFATGSKADAGAPIGIEGLRRVAASTTLPVAAIGGIASANLPQVRATGVAMAAVISAVADASDPYGAALALVEAWNRP